MKFPSNGIAFRVNGELNVTGLLFTNGDWKQGVVPKGRIGRSKSLFADNPPVLERLQNTNISESVQRSHVVVAMADPNDKDSFLKAFSFSKRSSSKGIATLLLATRIDPKHYKSGSQRTSNLPESKSVGSWPRPDFYVRRIEKAREAGREAEKSDNDYAFCILETLTNDPFLRLVQVAKSFARGWNGMIGVDLNQVRGVIGGGRFGWLGVGAASGRNRERNAAEQAFGELTRLGADIQRVAGAMVTMTTTGKIRLAAIRRVTRLFHRRVEVDGNRFVLAHDAVPNHDTSISVQVMTTAD